MIHPLFAVTVHTLKYRLGRSRVRVRCVSALACVQQTSRILFLSREAKEIADTFAYKLQAIIYRQKKLLHLASILKNQ